MQTSQIEIIRHHIIRYACGCTTTRIEVKRPLPETLPVCAGHDSMIVKEEVITEYREIESNTYGQS